jgi:rhamnogalacturonyl hydrolase YesR
LALETPRPIDDDDSFIRAAMPVLHRFMKIKLLNFLNPTIALLFLFSSLLLRAQPAAAPSEMTEIPPLNVLNVMQQVADWQLANPSAHKSLDWTQGAGYAGFMALAGISNDNKYREAMLAMANANNWQLGPRRYHADDHCVGQTYAELYFLYRDPKMIAPLRERFNDMLANPSTAMSLDFKQPGNKAHEVWSWCDSLFMGPPTWMRLYAATDDPRYMDFAVTNWWRTTDFLYDKDEHLFFRDSTYFDKKEANGKKVFWSRGNGWVMAGLVRMLQYLPMNHPDRPRFEQLFKDMAAQVLACQQPDGLWHSSMLDPGSFPLKETSGSGFFTYALAWGVNQHLLDRATYEPAVDKAWLALVGCVNSDGKLTYVQPVGADPKTFAPDSTEIYGVGGFLLAGSEVYRMAVLEHTKPIMVSVTNPSSFRRDCETVEVHSNGGAGYARGEAGVMDAVSSRILDMQIYTSEPDQAPDILLFQADLAPNETRTFYILSTTALPAVPQPIVKTFARYVPERFDDFAWESDRIAHRIYGPALETWQREPLTDSGIDVWIKRTRDPIVDQMYSSLSFFNTNGPSQDDFKVGHTRGCGGVGIWNNGTLYVSKNWHQQKLITTGPIRSEFVLTYEAWDVGNGRKVSETKRISIDAGSNLSHVESTFDSDDNSPLQVGVGLDERPGDNIFVADGAPEIDSWVNQTDKGIFVQTPTWMSYWQPQDFVKGVIGTAIILPKNSIQTYTNDNPTLPDSKFTPPTHTLGEGQPGLRSILAIVPAQVGTPLSYYLGAGWNESGDFPDAKTWNDYVRRFAERVDEPLQVTIAN